MPLEDRVPFKARAFNPFAFTRLLRAGAAGSAGRRTMRLLVALAALTLLPIFMGDVLQVSRRGVAWPMDCTFCAHHSQRGASR